MTATKPLTCARCGGKVVRKYGGQFWILLLIAFGGLIYLGRYVHAGVLHLPLIIGWIVLVSVIDTLTVPLSPLSGDGMSSGDAK